MSDQIIERIRMAAEELTGVPSAADPVEEERWRPGRATVVASAACLAMLLIGLAAVTNVRREDATTSSGPAWSSMTVQADAGEWLDLPAPPDGLRQETNLSLASTVVCTSATIVEDSLTCTELEGQIESHYLPTAAPPGADQSENEISVRFLYIDAKPADIVQSMDGRSPTQLSVRGTDGFMVSDDRETTVVWSERPGTISRLTTKTGTGHDPVALVESLVPRSWPESVRPPMIAVELGAKWSAFDDNHPYALATTRPDGDCISIGYVPSEATGTTSVAGENLACTASDQQAWTVGTISGQAGAADPAGAEQDVFAGLVPNSVTRVSVALDDGRELSVDTVVVPGLETRAWATLTGAPQGTIAVGTITGIGNDGDEAFTEPFVALMPTVVVDNVCFQPGTTGIVPDLVGQDLRAADTALRAAGLIIALPVSSDRLPIIIEQEPASGTNVSCGDVVLTYEE